MADPLTEVPLPQSVEQLLHQICVEQNQAPPSVDVRRKLACIGEEASLQLLHEIAHSKIRRNLSAYISYLLRLPPYSTLSLSAYIWGSNETIPSSPISGLPRESVRAQLEALGDLDFRKQFSHLNLN